MMIVSSATARPWLVRLASCRSHHLLKPFAQLSAKEVRLGFLSVEAWIEENGDDFAFFQVILTSTIKTNLRVTILSCKIITDPQGFHMFAFTYERGRHLARLLPLDQREHRICSQPDPLHLVLREAFLRAVVELGDARTLVR